MENYKKLENIKDYCDDLLNQGVEYDWYAKFSRIIARQGKEGEVVTTKMDNGLVETKNTVKIDKKTNNPGWIVKNVNSGEQWIIEDSIFTKKYEIDEKSNERNVYKPKGKPTIAIQIKENISFTAPWGEEMKIKEGGYLIINSPSDIYGIQKDEFHSTYSKSDKDGNFIEKNKKTYPPKR